MVNSGMPSAMALGISGRVQASRSGSSGSDGSKTFSSKLLGCTFDGEPVSSTASTIASNASSSSAWATGTISGMQPASRTASVYFLPTV